MKKYNNHKNIVLIGMSGVGKTTIGKYIAEKNNMEFMDTDDIIVSNNNNSIDNIFETYGEGYFRDLEREVTEDISNNKGMVISTGGGVVLDKQNIYNLKKNGIVFLLSATIDNIFDNMKSSYKRDDKRPLLKDSSDLKQSLKKLYEDRKQLYFSSADYIVDVDNRKVSQIGDEIVSIFDNLYPCD